MNFFQVDLRDACPDERHLLSLLDSAASGPDRRLRAARGRLHPRRRTLHRHRRHARIPGVKSKASGCVSKVVLSVYQFPF